MEMKICAYARTAVDLNAGISGVEEQKKYITEYIRRNFPEAAFDPEKDTFLDPNTSGYDFKRPAYQEMKAAMLRGEYNLVIVKNLARFCRRNTLGVMEIYNLRSRGIYIIGCDDQGDMDRSVDFFTLMQMIITD